MEKLTRETFRIAEFQAKEAIFCDAVREVGGAVSNYQLVAGMAVCHDLNIIEGEISGDPLDVKMFQATGWSLEQQGEEENQARHFLISTVLIMHHCW